MKTLLPRLFSTACLSVALLAPVAVVPTLQAADQKVYRDDKRKEEHHWNDHEDKAYRIWAKENHRKYKDFAKLKESERQQYWDWRHDHSDALLKIDIH